MPQNVRFGNNLHDRICTKCKRMREPQDYETRFVVYRTCNHCRFKVYQRKHPLNTYSDFLHRGMIVRNVDLDTDSNYSEQAVMHEYNTQVLSMSSSAAACTESHYGPEPEPEPEPDSKPEY